MMKYTLASKIFEEQFNYVRESINKTLDFLKEHSEMEVFNELQEVANDIFDCFETEYQDIRANDSYEIVSEQRKVASPLMEYWNEQIEIYGLQAIA